MYKKNTSWLNAEKNKDFAKIFVECYKLYYLCQIFFEAYVCPEIIDIYICMEYLYNFI